MCPPSIALAKNVREFLLHIFAVELRYAERLTGSPGTEYETLPTASVADLFATGDRGRGIFCDYFATVTDADVANVMEFPTCTAGTIRASKRKMYDHALLHSMRHWAQLATALRERDARQIGARIPCRAKLWNRSDARAVPQ